MKIADNHKPRTAQGLCIAIIAACIACVPQAEAITFDGNTSGIFVNPTGPSGMYATGVDTNYFQWGVGYYSPQSALYFSGTNFTGVSTDQYFDLGDLYYLNGTAWAGTQAYS